MPPTTSSGTRTAPASRTTPNPPTNSVGRPPRPLSLRLVPLVSAGLILFEWPALAQTNGPPVWASLGPHPVVGKGAGNFSVHEAPPPYAGRVTAIAPDPN